MLHSRFRFDRRQIQTPVDLGAGLGEGAYGRRRVVEVGILALQRTPCRTGDSPWSRHTSCTPNGAQYQETRDLTTLGGLMPDQST